MGLPAKNRVKLRYMEWFSLNPSAGAVSSYVYRANSIYDPNYTAAGHQPIGFDQLAALYDHYVVLSSRIKVSISGSHTEGDTVFGINLQDDYAVTGAWPALTEQSSSNWMVLGGSGGPRLPSISSSFDSRSFFGIKNPEDVREVGAAVTTNPTEGAYYIIYMQAADMSADITACGFTVELEYDCVFTERTKLSTS